MDIVIEKNNNWEKSTISNMLLTWQKCSGWKQAITLTTIVGSPSRPFSCFNARNLVWLAAWHTITTLDPHHTTQSVWSLNVMHTPKKCHNCIWEWTHQAKYKIKIPKELFWDRDNTKAQNTRLCLHFLYLSQFYTYLKKWSNSGWLPWQ